MPPLQVMVLADDEDSTTEPLSQRADVDTLDTRGHGARELAKWRRGLARGHTILNGLPAQVATVLPATKGTVLLGRLPNLREKPSPASVSRRAMLGVQIAAERVRGREHVATPPGRIENHLRNPGGQRQ